MKLKQCKAPSCGEMFEPTKPFQSACSIRCSIELSRERAALKAIKQRRAQIREGKRKLRTRSDWTNLAQAAFNAYVRERDKEQPCISCDVVNPPERYGGAWDCGHYLGVGAYPELRFDECNAHRQCKSCNTGRKHRESKEITVRAEYRKRLIRRIGLPAVEWLEGPHPNLKHTIEELETIEATYKAKLKELRHDQQCSRLRNIPDHGGEGEPAGVR